VQHFQPLLAVLGAVETVHALAEAVGADNVYCYGRERVVQIDYLVALESVDEFLHAGDDERFKHQDASFAEEFETALRRDLCRS